MIMASTIMMSLPYFKKNPPSIMKIGIVVSKESDERTAFAGVVDNIIEKLLIVSETENALFLLDEISPIESGKTKRNKII